MFQYYQKIKLHTCITPLQCYATLSQLFWLSRIVKINLKYDNDKNIVVDIYDLFTFA